MDILLLNVYLYVYLNANPAASRIKRRFPTAGGTSGCELLEGHAGKLNSGALQKQYVLLPTESSPQPPKHFIFK